MGYVKYDITESYPIMFTFVPQSAVFKQLRFVFKATQRLFSRTNILQLAFKMSWQDHKQNFLSMSGPQKSPNCETLDNILTWKAYASIKDSLPPKKDTLFDVTIDSSKNDILADKISIYTGDITHLEVYYIIFILYLLMSIFIGRCHCECSK